MFFVTFVVSFINLSIGPLKNTYTMHHIILPISFINPAILPVEHSFALKFVVSKLAFVVTFVGPWKSAVLFGAILKVAAKDGSIGPVFFPYSVLEIIEPLSSAQHSFKVTKLSKSLGFVEFPRAIIVVFIRMNVDSTFVEAVEVKMAIVVSTIKIEELAFALQDLLGVMHLYFSVIVAGLGLICF